MKIIFKKDGELRITVINSQIVDSTDEEGVTIQKELTGQEYLDWLLEKDRLPFTENDEFRVLDDALPEHPIEDWGGYFLEHGELPELGEYSQPVIMKPITRRQFRKAILREWSITFDQLKTQVQSLITDPTSLEDVMIDLEDASVFEWENPRILEIAAMLGKNRPETERVWQVAMAIE